MKWSIAMLVFLLGVSLTSCNAEEKQSEASTDLIQNAVPIAMFKSVGDEVKSVASVDIEGMMCSHACGGKITKELLKLQGAKDVEIAFSETQLIDQAIVEFDPSKLSAEEMIACIHKIADGKLYTVKSVTVTEYAPEG